MPSNLPGDRDLGALRQARPAVTPVTGRDQKVHVRVGGVFRAPSHSAGGVAVRGRGGVFVGAGFGIGALLLQVLRPSGGRLRLGEPVFAGVVLIGGREKRPG